MSETGSSSQSYDPQKDATAQEPLTPNEQKLVTRLFGDPFAFPMEFKSWLRGWLEEQFPRIGTLSSPANTGAAGAFVPPAGAILDYGGDFAPGGYVMCDGAEYDKTGLAYQRLFNAIGFKFGTGSDANHFKVPNFPGRVGVMRDTTDGAMNTVGQSGGEKAHTQSGAEMPSHVHTFGREVHGLQPGDVDYALLPSGGTTEDFPTDAAGGGAPMNVMQPFLVINKIISLGS